MNKILIAFNSFLLLFSSSCEKPFFAEVFYSIRVINNSPSSIRVLLAIDKAEKQYLDTTLPFTKPALIKVEPTKTGYFDTKTTWEENLEKLPADTLSIFFIENSVYEHTNWEEIRLNYQILKRLDLSIEDLKSTNFIINYP